MSSSDRSSLAKRLIKDLVIPKPDELGNCAASGPNGNRSGGGGCGGAILGATAGSQLLPSDGYVIVSFSNRKKAQIQTAMFSDVSKNSTDAINLLKAQNNGGSVGSQGARGEDQQMPDEDSFYGEAFWIGSEDEDEPGPMSGVESGSAEMRALAGGGESLDAANDSSQDENEHEPPVTTVAGAGAASCDSGSDLAGSNSAATGGNTTCRPHNNNTSQKMSRLTALSRGLLTSTENLNGAALGRGNKLLSARHKSYFGDSRAVYYGGGEDGRKMLRCRECGKHYRNDYSLRHHICLRRKEVWKKGDVPKELVDGQLIYFCPTCSKPFRWMGNLTRHFYVHTGQRFFKCDICDKEFFSAYQVRRHMNSHTGMRYKCRVCDKPFTCVYACTWHMRQHAPHSHSNAPGLPPGAAALSATCVATAAHSSSSSSSDTIASKMIISVPSSTNANANVTNINSNYNNNDNNININNNNNTLNINNNNTININNNNNTLNINNNNNNNKHKSDQVEKIAI